MLIYIGESKQNTSHVLAQGSDELANSHYRYFFHGDGQSY